MLLSQRGCAGLHSTGKKKILLLKPRGFCAGVVRAIDIVSIALDTFGKPIYVRKEIVHNRHVVDELTERGAIFVEELSEVPSGSMVIFSAHGVSPAVREEARDRKSTRLNSSHIQKSRMPSSA